MFCPQCGQERVSVETNYCSRCGFLLSAAAELLQTGGQNPYAVVRSAYRSISPRKRGLKQGLFLFLLTFLVAPLMGMITVALRIEPFLVGFAVVFFFIGGLLRMVYALMFESAEPGGSTLEEKLIAHAAAINDPSKQRVLAPQQTMPATSLASPAAGSWRDTNDLQPVSVTESTTKLLERDDLN